MCLSVLRRLLVFCCSRRMLLLVSCLSETRFFCSLSSDESLLHQWLLVHSPCISFRFFFKLVTKLVYFFLIMSQMLWSWCYQLESYFVHDSLHVAERIDFSNFLVDHFAYLFCVY